MNLNLKGKRALVCGSTQGIGKAAAIELALLGAELILTARNEEQLKKVSSELDSSSGQNHKYIAVDFSNPQLLQELVIKEIVSNGNIHVLVNNTGGPAAGPIASAKTDEFTNAFNQHLICNHLLVQACMEGMKKDHYGRIINVISTSVKLPLKGLGVSNTIRAAVANWSKTLSIELAPFGITVNNVLPGATNTVRLSSIIKNKSKRTGFSEEEIKQEMLHEIPAGRFAEASEIANAIAFLASPAAAYINGINVPVDGGRTGCL
jgi:3-oxoacyl-[acyl-carrier protein] reductase